MNIIDKNAKNLVLIKKTKNVNITIYNFFPFRKLSKVEKYKLINIKKKQSKKNKSNIKSKKNKLR